MDGGLWVVGCGLWVVGCIVQTDLQPTTHNLTTNEMKKTGLSAPFLQDGALAFDFNSSGILEDRG